MPHPTKDAFVAFLYELMRDHVTPGKIEQIVFTQDTSQSKEGWELTSTHLAKYAEEIVGKLTKQTQERLQNSPIQENPFVKERCPLCGSAELDTLEPDRCYTCGYHFYRK